MFPIQIGTCGWSYNDWRGTFYPSGLGASEYLPYYAERFPVVEVDSTFYRPPSAKVVAEWRDKTPDHFRFSLKVPRVITHEKVLANCRQDLAGYIGAVRELGAKLACCVLQFGYFNKAAFATLDAFLGSLDPFLADWPTDVPVAVELRNKAWLKPALFDCLRRHRAVWVLTDQAWMPSPLYQAQRLDVITGPFAYVRLLGDRAEVDAKTETLDRVVIDRRDQVHADAAAIRLLAQRVVVLTFVNNHFAGYAPQTIQELQAALDES
ncbi:MAG: DUF72 domain-containing protein [Gemmataceae bacterium]|nr:DUF72 domain-containing protein [Gemmataceae bacterium]